MKIFEKENKPEEAKGKKVSLDESAGEKLENAFCELKKECVRITRSQLASEAMSSYFGGFFEKDKEKIKGKYFDAQAFLKGKLGHLKTREDLENALKDTLNRKKRGENAKDRKIKKNHTGGNNSSGMI